jgi:ketosteroid isomerase-like protein
MKLLLSSILAITMASAFALAQGQNRGTPGTEGRPIQGRSPAPAPPGPLVDLVKATVEAYNKGDINYFNKLLADDVLWVDEDGHEMTTKMFALYLLNRQLTSTPKRTMIVHDIATGAWGDTGWTSFAFTIDDGINKRIGTHTALLRKVGKDWKVVLMHDSINTPAVPH